MSTQESDDMWETGAGRLDNVLLISPNEIRYKKRFSGRDISADGLM